MGRGFLERGAGGEREEGGETGKKKRKSPVWSKDGKSGLIFVSNVFPTTYGPCFGLYTKNLRGDP